MNPYAAAGWYNPANPNSINTPSWNTPSAGQPSIFGALPTLTPAPMPSERLIFKLNHNYPDILNCDLFTARGVKYLEIVTSDPHAPQSCTYFRKDYICLASVEWNAHSTVSINGVVNGAAVDQWFPVSNGHRTMRSRDNKIYKWVAINTRYEYSLYAVGSDIAQHPLASISRGADCVVLDISREAVQAGLLESCIVTTVLLHSRRLSG